MRTQCREKIRRRTRIPSALPGHSFCEGQEFIPDDAHTTTIPYGKIFKREEWGAVPHRKSDGKLTMPVMYVNTVNVFMEAMDGELEKGLKGPEAVRMFQKADMDNGLSDIRSNFIIDEDGLIYEGRGWEQKPGITKHDHPNRFMEYIEICYIGDFSTQPFNHPAHYATARLCAIAKDRKYISRDALMLNPKGEFYERKRVPKMPRYLPENPAPPLL